MPVTVDPLPTTAPLTYPVEPMTGNLDGFRLGALTVSDTAQVTPGYQIALITSAGYDGIATDEDRVDHRFPRTIGLVTVFREGVLNPEPYRSGESLTINGRPGKYVKSVRQGDLGSPRPAVIWEYDENAFAVVTDLGRQRTLTRAEMIDVAARVRSMASQPVTVGIKLSRVPPGFRLDAAGVADQSLSMSLDGQSHLRLIKGEYRYPGITGPIQNPAATGRRLPTIQLDVYPRWWARHSPPSGQPADAAFCVPSNICYRGSEDGRWQLEVSGVGVPDSELRRLLERVTLADPLDPSTWYKATEAVD